METLTYRYEWKTGHLQEVTLTQRANERDTGGRCEVRPEQTHRPGLKRSTTDSEEMVIIGPIDQWTAHQYLTLFFRVNYSFKPQVCSLKALRLHSQQGQSSWFRPLWYTVHQGRFPQIQLKTCVGSVAWWFWSLVNLCCCCCEFCWKCQWNVH